MELYKCNKCKDTKKVINDFGVEVDCDCVLMEELGISLDSKITKPVYSVSEKDKQVALTKRLIPENRIEDDFNLEIARQNILRMNKKRAFKVHGFDAYCNVLTSILNSIRAKEKLDCSYLIGAPNGFGKTTFVTTCLKIMSKLNMQVVPFISLMELAELLKRHRERLSQISIRVNKSLGDTEVIEDKTPNEVCWYSYDWTEYITADILFVYFSSVDNRVIESKMLQTILKLRGTKGLPTVAFIESSIDLYTKDEKLYEYIWDDILAYKSIKNSSYDRVVHISTYKKLRRE